MTKGKKKGCVAALFLLLALGLSIWGIGNQVIRWLVAEDSSFAGFTIITSDSRTGHDENGNGINDRTDFLKGVKAYLKTDPIYKSCYYNDGYPDDEYGVCTDVVAQGFLRAGYDLKVLMHEDIIEHRDRYDIEVVDENIDFRRVKNQKVYLEEYFTTLTTDLNEKSEWKAGDIVVFDGHIGVVSDRVNADGIPYLLHNGSVEQESYEQDVLQEKQAEIIGHYRL